MPKRNKKATLDPASGPSSSSGSGSKSSKFTYSVSDYTQPLPQLVIPQHSSVLHRFFSFFYLIHLVLFISYPYVRIKLMIPYWIETSQSTVPGAPSISFIQTQEMTLFACVGILLIIKWVNAFSIDHWLHSVCLYIKIIMGIMLFTTPWINFLSYMLVIGIMSLVVTPPFYTGPNTYSQLDHRTLAYHVLGFSAPIEPAPPFPSSMSQKEIMDKRISPKVTREPPGFWLVEFYTSWAYHCNAFAPIFATLSLNHSSPKLRFAKMDLGSHPEIAQYFGISLSATKSNQLPTIILFHKGKEVARLPSFGPDGNVKKHPGSKLSFQNVERYFSLQNIDYWDTIHNANSN